MEPTGTETKTNCFSIRGPGEHSKSWDCLKNQTLWNYNRNSSQDWA